MPVYCYKCEYCDIGWEVTKPSTRASFPEICPNCDYKSSVRDYLAENVSMQEAPKTLGSLADKNSAKMSRDQQQEINQQYTKKPKFSGKLPEGAKTFSD